MNVDDFFASKVLTRLQQTSCIQVWEVPSTSWSWEPEETMVFQAVGFHAWTVEIARLERRKCPCFFQCFSMFFIHWWWSHWSSATAHVLAWCQTKTKKNIRPLSPPLSAQQPFLLEELVEGVKTNKPLKSIFGNIKEETLSMVFQFLNSWLYLSLPICAFHWFFPCLRVSFHMLRLRRYLAFVQVFFWKPHWKVKENGVFHLNQNGCNHFAKNLQDYLIIQASAVKGLASSSTMEVSKCERKMQISGEKPVQNIIWFKKIVHIHSLKLTAKAPENRPSQKATIVFQPSIFQVRKC